jgi:hypothetical protein
MKTQQQQQQQQSNQRLKNSAFVASMTFVFYAIALFDWERNGLKSLPRFVNEKSESFGKLRENSMVIDDDNDMRRGDLDNVAGDDGQVLSERLRELRAEKEQILEDIKRATDEKDDDDDGGGGGRGNSKTARKKSSIPSSSSSYNSENFPEAIIESIERDLGLGTRAQRGAEEPARTMELARLRCLGAPEPWSPFDAGRKKDNFGIERRGGGENKKRRRMLLLGSDEGSGSLKVEEQERDDDDFDVEMLTDNSKVANAGRKLLAYRLPADKYKPLEPKCKASERVKKNIRTGEDAIVGCLKTNRCTHSVEDVFNAIQNLDGIKSLKNYVNCLTVNAQEKGCGVITGNPETFPFIGTRPPPKLKKETSRMYRTCALVGNGPGLQRDGMGEIIDKHDAVIRFNTFVSSGVWQNFTGTKSTLRVFNKKRAETMKSKKNVYIASSNAKDKKDVENELWIFWNYMSFPFLAPVLRANKNTALLAPDVIKYMVTGYFKARTDLHRLGYKGFQCPTNVNSGVHAMYMAMQMCERVNLFGFSYSMDMLNKRSDARSPRMSRFHDWAFDTMLVHLLHLSGYVNVCTS